MRPIASTACLFVALAATTSPCPAAQDAPKPDSSYVKLLKKAPEARVGQIVDIIGKRGDADDLAYLFNRATDPQGFSADVRRKALEVLADVALTRDLRPSGDLSGLGRLLGPDSAPGTRRAAIRLAGLWKAEATLDALGSLAEAEGTNESTRTAAFDAISSIGGESARKVIEGLAAPDRPASIRIHALAALARLDVDAAADQVAGILAGSPINQDIAPLMAAFLDLQGGAEKLAAALGRRKPLADNAKLGLRGIYALGRADESLVAVLSRAAGIEAESKPLDKAEMEALSAEVAARGNAQRGEAIFRRPEMSCMKCHALSGAAGGVGPELSAVGLSSPVDYVVYSILLPDQSIKEEYQTRVVLTDDGRVLQGIVVEEDDKKLVLRDATAEIRVVPTASIEDSKKGGSLMPKGLANMLTHAEFVDLVRFVSELGKPGPYALKSVPTIQRWRVLKTGTEGIKEILEADPGEWSPAYAEVAGNLPISEIAADGASSSIIQGEITVSAAGPITFRFEGSQGLTSWLDDRPIPAGDSPTVEIAEGRHKLTVKVDLDSRGEQPIRVEVAKPEGSSAEFSVVGGR
ncbi:HEAT repeat domain-containing protein [Tundrisphaera lichenicola]|uniref:HEAT repeat domain-containing protein n=1 Tax=Tundrisphaera lichenicola TaxID=2029860 RepID=UPI003EB80077